MAWQLFDIRRSSHYRPIDEESRDILSKPGWNDRLGLKALGLKDRKTRYGARGRTWTGTVFPPTDFKSVASTNFATRAYWWGLKNLLLKLIRPALLVGSRDYTLRTTQKGTITSCMCNINFNYTLRTRNLEARVGIEPTMAELQSSALPLCYRA